MGWIAKGIYIFLSFVVSLIALCCARTLFLTLSQPESPQLCNRNESEGYLNAEESWPRFREALRYRTVSSAPHEYNREELGRFVDFLIASYPSVFKSPYVKYDVINGYSLLITVQGTNSKLTPYLLAAHLDVVPVIQEEWTYEAFAATEAENGSMVYGRGAIDNKPCVIAILEATSFMITRGIKPERGFYIAFGHDEEVSGHDGAAYIAKELRKRKVDQLDFVVDEGLPVLSGMFPGVEKHIAGIGVTEKGSLTLNLSVHAEGGHSSMPPRQSSIGILSTALSKLEANPHKIIIDDMTENFLESLALEMSFPLNVVVSNLWLFKYIIGKVLTQKSTTEALVRTTTAITMFRGGIKTNVIPPSAWAVVNHRIHPKQTVEEIIRLDKATIDDDRVVITKLPGSHDPHPISPHCRTKDRPYRILEKSIRQIHGDVIPAPLALIANTDTTHYLKFTKHVFRHNGFVLNTKTEVHRIHGRDERLSRSNFESLLNFFYHLMLNANEQDSTKDVHSHSSEL